MNFLLLVILAISTHLAQAHLRLTAQEEEANFVVFVEVGMTANPTLAEGDGDYFTAYLGVLLSLKYCIVQSYLQWLEDNDYIPVCELCKKGLNAAGCIRLICYHVFHQHCLHEMGKQVTAKEGTPSEASFCCPTCGKSLFPPTNMVSPVADNLKDVLMKANWARNIMGLPELADVGDSGMTFSRPEPLGSPSINEDVETHGGKQRFSAHSVASSGVEKPQHHREPLHAGASVRRQVDVDSGSAGHSRTVNMYEDEVADKYKFRRPRFESILRWWSDLVRPSPRLMRNPNYRTRRIVTFVIMGALALFLLLTAMSWLGGVPDDDPAFDEHNNPYVHTE
ncbi:unnamed protein product [Notodromas monacha]|uniref:Zinc finger protein-like 1 homolog n=1 Tax=Notodromas monacha TaxID=399045 RepID=A0A7R9BU08_9CRUS|nr:unnamed protein product [Notodromas monacha]CAG0921402.1 unnamed protein product [Notodromas monacha]